MSGELRVQRTGDVCELTLVNPAKRNALDSALCRALTEALQAAGSAGVRAVILTGEGDRAFSAGFDLDELGVEASPAQAEAIFGGLMGAMAACPVPIVCALNGSAFGGGFELAAACDLRVAHAGIKLAMPPARLGIAYPVRGLVRFAALCGDSRARQLFLTARVLTAETALAWGLLDEVVPADQVIAHARTLAAEIASLSAPAIAAMRFTFEAMLRRRAALSSEDTAEGARLQGLALAAFQPPRRS